MLKKILIDAFYPEETKFILIGADGKLEEFYYQNFNTKLIKGNIYLGKVSRIEPSLQAAFIDYGNDKKGFLSFEMIHPKYYQIPVGDKEQLLNKIKENKSNYNEDDSSSASEYPNKFVSELYDNYKIQEVIKKDQIILVQVEKEERGNKGAFLTTYISLSGRYCVFSPNSFKNNIGISRKLDDEEERERLKKISSELLENYGESSLILRTASAHRTKLEIKRDFEYLINIWEKIKNSAVSSFAPSLVYEEGDILINNIKEHYTSEVEKIIVSGNEAYKKVSDFLKIFIPKNIQKLEEYSNKVPILHKYKVEEQLSNLYSNVVKLKSGGYLVINTTEAMISIDVNSGTYTEEYSIENTALNTNLEAAVEIAKQVRFRGLSGLIVVDFIDMLELQNKKLVEREFKKAFWNDKVKVQIGRISEFGLLEMSRQRVGKSFIEANSKVCPTCLGKGRITLNSSISTLLIGKLTFLLSRKKAKVVSIIAASDIITYLMNNFKNELSFLENSYNIQIHLSIDDIISPENYKIIFHQTSNIAAVKNRRYNRPESFVLNDLDNIENKEIFNNFEEDIVEHDGNINYIKMQSKRLLRTNFRKRKKNRNNGMKNSNKQNNDRSSIFKKIWSKVTS
jgi:ribonuclease E